MADETCPEIAQRTMTIVLENLSEPQRLALEDMLAYWLESRMGSSRWMAFYVDGDGNFRPRITVDGRRPEHQHRVPPGRFWTGGVPWQGEYRIDYDAIAWTFHKEPESVDAVARSAADQAARPPDDTTP